MKKTPIASALLSALFAVSALAMASGSATAADLARPVPGAPSTYKASPVIPVFSWTGVYIGVDGGWGWGQEDFTDNSVLAIPPGNAISHKPDGGIFGGVFGYRYQAGSFVFGAEGTAAWADLHDNVAPASDRTDSFKVQSIYSATGQVGWAFTQALVYAKGGWAGSSVLTSISTTAGGLASETQFDSGWTVGAGLDYAVWQNCVFGVEYDYFDLSYGGFSTVGILGNTYVVADPSHLTIQQVLGRLIYKFNLP